MYLRANILGAVLPPALYSAVHRGRLDRTYLYMIAPHNGRKYRLPHAAWYAHSCIVRVHVGVLLGGECFWWDGRYLP